MEFKTLASRSGDSPNSEIMKIPFRVGEIALGPDFAGRRAELTRIQQAMWSRGRLLVTGVRGQGKRSTVTQAFQPVGGRGGILLRANLGTTENASELLRRWVAQVPPGWRQRTRLLEFLRSVGLRPETGRRGPERGVGSGARSGIRSGTGSGTGTGPEKMERPARRKDDWEAEVIHLGVRSHTLAPGEAEAQIGALLHWLDGVAAHHPAPIVLTLDEVQHADRIHSDGFQLLGSWVSATRNLPWILCGSPHVAPSLRGGSTAGESAGGKGASRGGVAGLEHMELGPIPEGEMAGWIEKQFQGHGVEPEPGVGRRILEVAGLRTVDRIRLSRRAYLRSLGRDHLGAEEVEAAYGDLILEGTEGFERLWQEFPPYQRAVLRAVAAGVEQLHSQAAAFEYDLPVSSAVTKAVQILRKKGHLSEESPITLADPFFRGWVLRRAMPDTVG